MTTRVVNIHHTKDYDVYIGRSGKGLTGKWGNPFHIGRDGNRKEVLEKYREYILNTPRLRDSLPELKDKVLGCFCKPKACHGDILVELVEARKEKSIMDY